MANVLVIADLSKVCKDRLLDEKWLLAPSLRAGHEWITAVARAGQPVVNAHVQTVMKLALSLAAPHLADEKRTLISRHQGTLIVEQVMRRLQKPDGYLWKLPPSERLAATVFNALDAIRRAGLNSADLSPDHFEVAAKGLELIEISSAYLEALRDGGWIDRADALGLAIERLRTDTKALAESVLVLVPEDIDLTGLERQLLDAIPKRQVVRLSVDQAGAGLREEGESRSDLGVLRWLHAPALPPDPVKHDSAFMFRAVGEVNEVRGVLRRCLAQGIPLDHVELLCTDKATYLPLVYEVFPRQQRDDSNDDDIPVTFQEGLPARRFRPGRALFAWLAWMRDDYPQRALVHMIREGLLKLPEHEGDTPSFARLAGAFASMKIGFGRERYLKTLDEHVAASKLRSADPESLRDEDGLLDTRRRSPAERLNEFQILRELIDTLLKLSARAEQSGGGVLECAREILEKHVREAGRLDTYASHGLIKRIKELERAVDPGDEQSSIDFRAWLAALADDVWVGGEGPRPGRLHVADVLAGGHSGRPHTFIVGLDDGRFPGSGLQDPILLDDEAGTRLSPDLPRGASPSRLARQLDQVCCDSWPDCAEPSRSATHATALPTTARLFPARSCSPRSEFSLATAMATTPP